MPCFLCHDHESTNTKLLYVFALFQGEEGSTNQAKITALSL